MMSGCQSGCQSASLPTCRRKTLPWRPEKTLICFPSHSAKQEIALSATRRKQRTKRELDKTINNPSPPSATYFLQQGYPFLRFHNLPPPPTLKCSSVETKSSNTRGCGTNFPFKATQDYNKAYNALPFKDLLNDTFKTDT